MLVAKERSASFWERLAKTDKSDSEGLRKLGKEISELRWIKHRLHVAKTLSDCGELPPDSTLNEWLQIREQLP
jgi:hypothetical protein